MIFTYPTKDLTAEEQERVDIIRSIHALMNRFSKKGEEFPMPSDIFDSLYDMTNEELRLTFSRYKEEMEKNPNQRWKY